MRITSSYLVDRSLDRLQTRLGSFEDAQARLASGRAFERASEDVIGMNVSLSLRSEQKAVEQALRNGQDGRTRASARESQGRGQSQGRAALPGPRPGLGYRF